MKYSSTINNIKCLEWDLTLSQAFLLDLLTYAPHWAQTEKLDGVDYYWVSRNKVLGEIPNAFKTADTVYRALKELHQKGVIEHQKLGRKDMVRFTEKGLEWVFKTAPTPDLKLGNKSELGQNSEINPSKLGNKSENTPKNSEISPTDKNTNNKSISNKKREPKTDSKKEDVFKPVKPEQVSDQTWNDLLGLRKKKRAVESQTAWTRINNSIERAQQATGHTLENIFSYWVMRAWAGFDEKWYINAHPQPTNNFQGNTHANNQPANNKPRRETTEEYKQRMQREFNQEFGIEVQPDSHTDCYS